MAPKRKKITRRNTGNKTPKKRNSSAPVQNYIVNTALTVTNKAMLPRSVYKPTGLTQKETSFVICKCQASTKRYLTLKCMATNAIKNNQIFTIYGNCNAVRTALVQRGWVEKMPVNRMNLIKIRNGTLKTRQGVQSELERLFLSSLVTKQPSNFIWRNKDDMIDVSTTVDVSKDCASIENRLTVEPLWTSKQGLCISMKRYHWFYLEDVAEVSTPRSYNTSESGDIENFERDYRITACTSLLKWILTKVADNCLTFSKSGKISCNVLVFALNVCKGYVYRKQNKDIDKAFSTVSNSQWNSFLKKYYCIINKKEMFKLDCPEKLPIYLAYARCLLEEIYKYRPQLSCEGCHNVWIIKPAHNSRGRGIRMASNLSVITSLIDKSNSKFVIQKYIEEPALIHDTKFDIRQYCLVTSTCPLIIWMYRDCYLKFSSQKYNLMDYHEAIHLTNNAVQRKYANCQGRHQDLPSNNMWHSDTFKGYLNSIGKSETWDKQIYPAMKKAIIGIMLCSQDMLPVSRNRFELYGCDFIIDKMYTPWLIEINSGPDLQHTTSVTAQICPAVIEDIIKVVIDYPKDRHCSTGNFECIYRQPFTMPKYSPALDLCVQGYTLPNNYFYKGIIPTRPSYEVEALQIKKADSSNTLVNKMKHSYGLNQLFQQLKEEGKPVDMVCKNGENEAIISIQLEEFMEKVISNNSSEDTITSNPIETNLSRLISIDNVSTLLKKSITFLSSEISYIDEPMPSSDKINNFERVYDIPNSISKRNGKVENNKNIVKNSKKKLAEEATSKIFNFMVQKEKEYLINQRCIT